MNQRRNIVLVTIDSLRADHCGFMGYNRDITPTLDKMAEDGLVFEKAIASGPRTPSSVPEALTGVTAAPFQGEQSEWERRRNRIRRHVDRYQTLAGRLSAIGYSTFGFSANPWTQGTGFEREFQQYEEINGESVFQSGAGTSVRSLLDTLLSKTPIGDRINWHLKRDWFVEWNDLFDRFAAEKIRESTAPFFLWFFLLDTHEPYMAPAEYRMENSLPGMAYSAWNQQSLSSVDDGPPDRVDERIRMAYRDAIRSIDGFVKTLREELSGTDPLFVFHSDHGDAFGEHGTYGHLPQLYEENLHVPLLVHNADVDKRIDRPFSLRNLPELTTHLVTEEPIDPEMFCSSAVISSTETGGKTAVRTRNWKYITSENGSELYNLRWDPKEAFDISEQRDRLVDELHGLVNSHDQHIRERERLSIATRRVNPGP